MIFQTSKPISNLLPLGSDDFITGWVAYQAATVASVSQRNIMPPNMSNGGDTTSDTTGVAARSNSTVTRVTTDFWQGAGCFQVITNGVGASEGINTSGVLNVVAGQRYTLSVYLKGSGTVTFTADYLAAGAITFPITGSWARYSFSAIATTTGAVMAKIYTNSTQAVTFLVDGWQHEIGGSASPWVIGTSQVYTDPLGGYSCSRITSTGGTNVVTYLLAAYVSGIYSSQCWVKNNGANTVVFTDTAGLTVNVVLADNWKKVQIQNSAFASTNFRFGSLLAGNALDFCVYQPMIEAKGTCSSIYVPPGYSRRIWR